MKKTTTITCQRTLTKLHIDLLSVTIFCCSFEEKALASGSSSDLLIMESSSSTRTTSVQKWQSNVRVLHDFPLQYHALVIANLSWKLISILYHGTPRWIAKLIRLILFVISLLPAFVVFACYYVITSDRIAVSYIQEIPKRTSRHYLDVYGSQKTQQQPKCEEGKAVVIFLTGGAWIIGYKMWGALLARALVRTRDRVCIPSLLVMQL